MANIARNLNGQFFGFNLFGFNESMQYTVYKDNGGHYDWHIDKGILSSSPRKLSLVLQLSDPSEYEGGDLEIMISKDVIKLEKRKGLVWAFPSWVLHRVTPVTKGIRRTIVVWVTGPKFV
jgi:PKHD-type hydroxylase